MVAPLGKHAVIRVATVRIHSDSHLIAAAPELYDRLSASSLIGHTKDNHGNPWEHCGLYPCRQDNEVLARARGEVSP